MPKSGCWSLAGAVLLAAAPLGAQATHDEARMTVGVAGGWISGAGLWSVRQPVFANNSQIDLFSIARDVRPSLLLSAQLTYFPKPKFGWTGELTYLGLGTTDGCAILDDHGDVFNRLACGALAGHKRAASGVAALGGIIYRLSSRGDLQPYLRAQAGIGLVPRSTTAVTAFFGQDNDTALPIYLEEGGKEVKPVGALSLGLATAVRNGYQFRLEARGTAIQLATVTGPTAAGSLTPETGSKWLFLPSITVAWDIVLEKRRGRRY